MKSIKIFLLLFLFSAGILKVSAQETVNISFKDIVVSIKGNESNGKEGSYPFVLGKTSLPFQLYVSDSLTITAKYRLNAYNSKRSQVKDSSLRLHVFYTVVYHDVKTEKKVEKMYFLDQERKFSDKETFNLNTGKYSNTLVNLSYKGMVGE